MLNIFTLQEMVCFALSYTEYISLYEYYIYSHEAGITQENWNLYTAWDVGVCVGEFTKWDVC
jgi:hypothetical protein